MFKKTVKLKLHSPKCKPIQFGNWVDLAVNGTYHVKSPEIGIDLNDGNRTPILHSKILDLGVSMTLPKWYRAEIKPRSSTFKKYGIILSNSVGEIEASYSGIWMAHVIKLTSNCEFKDIEHGSRLFQFQISLRPDAPFYIKILNLFISGFKFKQVDVLTTTRKGFGSTGK